MLCMHLQLERQRPLDGAAMPAGHKQGDGGDETVCETV